MTAEDPHVALAEGRWAEARAGFERMLADADPAADTAADAGAARFGLASALWWLGESEACVYQASRAYALLRAAKDDAGAARCATWLAITYKANFANAPAANGWLARTERLLADRDPDPLHGWLWLARGYQNPDLAAAEELTVSAVDVARRHGDVDLELVALSQLGVIRVGQGDSDAGFRLVDEAMAAVLSGERTTLDTVVYTCCDMLNACEIASDLDRAALWCQLADDFVQTYGCPFLYGECRIYYGSVLAARGRWAEAEQELDAGLRITRTTCPALHARGRIRLAQLRIRQGRLEDAERLLAGDVADVTTAAAERDMSLAALLLARGDTAAARRKLEQRLRRLEEHDAPRAAVLDALVDTQLVAGDVAAADGPARRLVELASRTQDRRHEALAAGATGRIAAARGDDDQAIAALESALASWTALALPFDASRTRLDLARALARTDNDNDADNAEAVEHARRALGAFEELGAALEADRAAAFLRSLGVPVRTGVRGPGVLTVREQDVLRLLAAGLSNPEIAQRLHVSRKTASHHVSAILTKLNLRNRAEAAVYAVRAEAE